MGPLRGTGVLVTRPQRQAAELCRLLEESGASVVRLPAIDVVETEGARDLVDRIGALPAFDLVIFTSANAVRFGAALLARQTGSAIAAIGPATARALDRAGRRVSTTPGGKFDSESLLQDPMLAKRRQRVLIVKGEHGRTTLQEELGKRGADVVLAEVYRRERATHDAAVLAAVEEKISSGEIHIVTATSAEIAASLLETASYGLRRAFERVQWVVPGARVAALLREYGLSAPILQAETAADQDLLAAITRWRSSVSGA